MTYTTQDVNQAFEALAKWNAAGVSLTDEFKNLADMINQIQGTINGLNSTKIDLNNQLQQYRNALVQAQKTLNDLKNNGGTKDQIAAAQAAVDTLNGEITTTQQSITQNTSDLANAQETENNDESALHEVSNEINARNGGSQSLALNQQNNQATNNSQNPSNDPQPTALTPQELAAQEQAAINAYANQVAMLTQDIQAKLVDLQNNKTQLDKDNAEDTQLVHEITELSIEIAACYAAAAFTFGASLAAIPYLAYKLGCAVKALIDVRADEQKCKDAITSDTAAIKSDFEQLKAADIGQIQSMLDTIDQLIKSILPLLGNHSESGMQAAAAAVVQVLQYLQLLLAQVHEKRTEDQQYMSQSSTVNYEVSTSKSSTDSMDFAANLKYAQFMKVVMIVAQVVLTVAAIAAAVATGGAGSILLALVMATFTAISICTDGKVDVMGEATQALAKAMDNGKDSGWSKVVADILIAVAIAIICIATDGAGASALAKFAEDAGEGAAEGLISGGTSAVKNAMMTEAKGMLSEAMEIEMQTLGKSASEESIQAVQQEFTQQVQTIAKTFVTDIEKAGEELGEEAVKSASQQAVKSGEQATGDAAKDATKSAVGATLKKLVLMTTMNFMMNNGLVDSSQAIALAFKTQDELDKDQTFQIIQVIIGILQAILMALAARGAFAAEGEETSFLQKILGKMDIEFNFATITQATTAINLGGSALQGAASAGTAWVDSQQATIMHDMAEQQFQQVIMQSVLKNIQSFEKMNSQQFAVLIQQEASSLNGTIQKMGAAEMEAARLMLETAV